MTMGATVNNPSFEVASGDVASQPDGWDFYLESYSWGFMPVGGPHLFTEAHEYGYDYNQNALSAFGSSDLDDYLFGTALAHEETYESEWESNEDALDGWPGTALAHQFDLADDDVEDYEEEWSSRHLERDDRLVTDDPLFGLSDSEVRARLNETKATWNAHLADTDKHKAADTVNVITSPDATDEASTAALINELWIDVWTHINDSSQTWHRPYWDFEQTQPTQNSYPAATYADAADLLVDLVVHINLHFSWCDNDGPRAIDALIWYTDFIPGVNTVYQGLQPLDFGASGSTEEYEAQWESNENALADLSGHLTFMDFQRDLGGTEAVDTYEEQISATSPFVTGQAGPPLDLDPTGPVAVTASGNLSVGTVMQIQTQKKNSATWVTESELDSSTPLPFVYNLHEGAVRVRIRTDTWAGGSPVFEVHWSEL